MNEASVQSILDEGPITLSDAAKLCGSHPSSFGRFCNRGTSLSDGTRLFLEHVKIGGKIMTSRAAVMRFLARQNQPAAEPPQAPTPAARNRTAAKASAQVAGLLGVA